MLTAIHVGKPMREVKTSATTLWIIGAVFVIGLLGWAVARILNDQRASSKADNATPTRLSEAGAETARPFGDQTETYVNQMYGFAISYPKELKTRPFVAFHAIDNRWRVSAPLESRGVPVVSIPVLRVDGEVVAEKTYPLFFDAEVRIGVSDDVAGCYAMDEGYTMQTVADVEINGVAWKKFIFGDAAMMQYISGASYRTIRNGRCYVIEQVRTGSTYRDETMTEKYSDKELDAYYAETTPIVMSFRFTR